jgi:hypothetical protein
MLDKIAKAITLLVCLAYLAKPTAASQVPCNNTCVANGVNSTTICSGPAQSCLILSCNIFVGAWYLSAPNNTLEPIAYSPKQIFMDNYDIVSSQGKFGLYIANLTRDTYGQNRYKTVEETDSPEYCYFSVFVYGTSLYISPYYYIFGLD